MKNKFSASMKFKDGYDYRFKVEILALVFDLEWTPTFQWCMLGCELNSEHHQDMC